MNEMDTPARNRLVRKLIVDLTIMTVIGVVLAFIGPFGSFEQPLILRLIAWLGFSYLGYAIYSPMGYVVERMGQALDLPKAGLWVAAVLIATIPMTMAVMAIGYLPDAAQIPSLEIIATTYMYVLIVGGGITALFYVLEARNVAVAANEAAVSPMTGGAAADDVPPGDSAKARFLDRLPPAVGTDLLALEMEDHYVRAHTVLGSDLILLRMRDAVAELDGIEGQQVHRSWWVAKDAVEGSRREGRNIRLKLTGGLEAPVSRNAAPMLKEQGWL